MDDATLARVLLALENPRHAVHRLRPVVRGRPHPQRRLPRLQIAGLLRPPTRTTLCRPVPAWRS